MFLKLVSTSSAKTKLQSYKLLVLLNESASQKIQS